MKNQTKDILRFNCNECGHFLFKCTHPSHVEFLVMKCRKYGHNNYIAILKDKVGVMSTSKPIEEPDGVIAEEIIKKFHKELKWQKL